MAFVQRHQHQAGRQESGQIRVRTDKSQDRQESGQIRVRTDKSQEHTRVRTDKSQNRQESGQTWQQSWAGLSFEGTLGWVVELNSRFCWFLQGCGKVGLILRFYHFVCAGKCRGFTLFHRKSWLRGQEAGKIKEPCRTDTKNTFLSFLTLNKGQTMSGYQEYGL